MKFVEEVDLLPKAQWGPKRHQRQRILDAVAANPGQWCYCANYPLSESAHTMASSLRKLAKETGATIEVTIRRFPNDSVGVYVKGL
jgi:hypothetical protein